MMNQNPQKNREETLQNLPEVDVLAPHAYVRERMIASLAVPAELLGGGDEMKKQNPSSVTFPIHPSGKA